MATDFIRALPAIPPLRADIHHACRWWWVTHTSFRRAYCLAI